MRKLLTYLNEENSDSAVTFRKNTALKYPVIKENMDNLMWMVQVSKYDLYNFVFMVYEKLIIHKIVKN